MKKGINKSCYIKCLASIYGIVMLMILFGRPSYDTWEPYWEQVKMNINLMPFRTISQYLYLLIKRRLIFHAFINLFGNIVAFIPMGIFLSCLSGTDHKILHSILWSTLIIIGIEFIQLFTLRGSCDIDDLFLNLFGVMLGNLALHIYEKVHKSEVEEAIDMYQAELDVVKSVKEKFGENLPLPADELEIKRFSKAFSEVFHMDIPQAYPAFLKLCNGFEFNGCIIYSCQNMIENQQDYDFIADDYIVFAEYDIGWFCLEKSSGKYCELDSPSGEMERYFDTLEEMIKYVIRLSVEM